MLLVEKIGSFATCLTAHTQPSTKLYYQGGPQVKEMTECSVQRREGIAGNMFYAMTQHPPNSQDLPYVLNRTPPPPERSCTNFVRYKISYSHFKLLLYYLPYGVCRAHIVW